MDYRNVPIPDEYTEAIQKAMVATDSTVSTVRLNAVLDALPETHKDKPAAVYFLKAYKAQNKRVNRLQTLLDAAQEVIDGFDDDSPSITNLSNALALFNDNPTEGVN